MKLITDRLVCLLLNFVLEKPCWLTSYVAAEKKSIKDYKTQRGPSA